MKLGLVIFTIALMLLTAAAASGQERMRLTRYVYGQKLTVKVFDADLEKMPSWDAESEEVPLSPRKAVEVARINLLRLIPKETEKWALDKVSLTQLRKGKWLYEVEFENLELLGSEMDWLFSVFVKMDGTIVEPQVAPHDGTARVY